MRLRELLEIQEEVGPDEEELKNIRMGKELKDKPTAQDMWVNSMPGNQCTYPAL